MSAIWKYPIPVNDRIVVFMPHGAKVLSVAVQQGEPCIWAIVDPSKPAVPHHFELRGTGHQLGDVGEFISSFLMYDGSLVFHLFHAPD